MASFAHYSDRLGSFTYTKNIVMKRILSLLLCSSFVLIACNNDKPKDGATDGVITIKDKEGKEKGSIDPSKMGDLQDYQKIKEDLEKLTPLTEEQLKALVPEEFMGGVRTDLDVSNAMGASLVSAKYIIRDSIKVQLEIVDCAGPGGSGLFGMQYLNMFDVNSDDEREYVKTIEFNGGKAFENCKKNRNRCSLAYFSGTRFLISLNGDNTGIEALKDAAKGLNIK
jgi:hypothetical protein